MTENRILVVLLIMLLPTLSFAGDVSLPRTGQTICSDNDGVFIDCAGTGQDGDIQSGVEWPLPRFTDNSDGTVTDNLTGLIWLKNANRFGTKTWSQALSDCNTLADDGINLTDGSVAGDWRLPNILELESLVNSEEPDTSIWLNTQGYINVQWSTYWSSTTYTGDTTKAWNAFMMTGHLYYHYSKSQNGYVWPVRSGSVGSAQLWKTGQTNCYNQYGYTISCTGTGQDGEVQAGVQWPSPRFIDNNDGTITDQLTKLVWLKRGPTGGMNWQPALEYCNSLCDDGTNLTDGSVPGDWHMPNRKELMSLIDFSQFEPALLPGHPLLSSIYWSANTTANSTTGVWAINLHYGNNRGYYKLFDVNSVCAVRPIVTICLADFEGEDGDIDGADLAEYTLDLSRVDIQKFALSFGSDTCGQ